MNSNPLFSVLIANYNNGQYLLEAVESVFAQTYANWEIIIVDDCSTDNSNDIYSQIEGDTRIKVAVNDTNRGCGFTKRRCAELASGDLCGFLDPDDKLSTDALQIMQSVHTERPEVALVCSRHALCDDNMNKLWESEKRDKLQLKYLTERSHTVEVFASFKTELYRKTLGINPTFQRAVDQDLYYLMEEQGEMCFIDNVLYNYRLHNNSLSIGHYKAMYWHVLAIEAACKRRGLEAEEVVGTMFGRLMDREDQKYRRVKESLYYKLGYSLLHPFERVKRKLKKLIKP